jgi:VanZ family protein
MTPIKLAKINARRHSPLLLTLLTLLILCVATIESVRKQDLVWGPLHDSSHSFVFFFLSLIGYILFSESTKNVGLRLIIVAGASFAAGIVIELVQPFIGRSASFSDIYYNFIGICSGALLFLAINAGKKQFAKKAALSITAAFLLASSLTVPAMGYYTYAKRDGLLPVLLDFEESWQRRLWRAGGGAHASVVDAPEGWDDGSKVVRIDYPKRTYPGFTIKHVSPDWTSYNSLHFSVFSKLEVTKELTLRVNDRAHIHQYHDRYNGRILVRPGLNHIKIDINLIKSAPRDRNMQMHDIAELALFAVKPNETFSLYFDDFRLEK